MKDLANVRDQDRRDYILAEMVQEMINQGRLLQAVDTVRFIRSDISNDTAVRDLIDMRLRGGDFDAAVELIGQLRIPESIVQALDAIALAQFKSHPASAERTLQNAVEIAQSLPAIVDDDSESRLITFSNHPRDELLGEIAAAEVGIGKVDCAFDLVTQIENQPERETALSGIAEAAAQNGDVGTVRRIMGLTSEPNDAFSPTFKLAEAMAKSGDFRGAKALAETQESPNNKAIILSEIARAYWDKSERRASVNTIEEAAETAEHIPDEMMKRRFLGSIGQAELEVGDPQAAAVSLAQGAKEVRNWREIPNIAADQARAGDIAGALDTARHAIMFPRAYILRGVARAQAESGNSQAALSWITSLDSPEEKASSLVGLAQGILDRQPKPN